MKKNSPVSGKRSVKKTASAPVPPFSAGAVPRADVHFSEEERKRRERFQKAKEYHRPTEAELLYGQPLPVWEPGWLLIQGARQNNLKSIDVPIPLSAFTAVTGVSGSGKSSLIEEILSQELARILHRAKVTPGAFDRIIGIDRLNKVIEVDQQPLGLTPNSNPATYTGLFDHIRNLYSNLPESRIRGWSPRRFSFNVPGGRCEKCEGAGQLKIEMHFLADVWITCDACGGKRYDSQTLEVTYKGKSIADVLEMPCGEALRFFASVPPIRRILKILCDVGLDYIPLGQSATMLSGGEAQRVKLAAELARPDTGRTLYILDEPTTGLHFEDLQKLLSVLQRLVDLGNTVVVIEHNLDVIKSVDWVIDLGPEAGLNGGELVFAGTPEELAEYGRARMALSPAKRVSVLKSWTAESLIPVLDNDPYQERVLYNPLDDKIEAEESEELASVQDASMPWETDGRLWHTQTRRTRSGLPCRWDGQILSEVVDRIEDSGKFAEVNWKNRAFVEICSDDVSLGSFFRAATGDEWLLKLIFRVPKTKFDKDALMKDLYLKPLSEVDEIPLYGTQPRVKIETEGSWYAVELRPHSYEEFDRPEVWDFIGRGIESFGDSSGSSQKNPSAASFPWKVNGEDWHYRRIGKDLVPEQCWDISLLDRLAALLRRVGPGSKEVWTNKLTVPFRRFDDPSQYWCMIYTKNSSALILQIYIQKGTVSFEEIQDIGKSPSIDDTDPMYDSIYLQFAAEKDFDEEKIERLLREALENPYGEGRSLR